MLKVKWLPYPKNKPKTAHYYWVKFEHGMGIDKIWWNGEEWQYDGNLEIVAFAIYKPEKR